MWVSSWKVAVNVLLYLNIWSIKPTMGNIKNRRCAKTQFKFTIALVRYSTGCRRSIENIRMTRALGVYRLTYSMLSWFDSFGICLCEHNNNTSLHKGHKIFVFTYWATILKELSVLPFKTTLTPASSFPPYVRLWLSQFIESVSFSNFFLHFSY